MFSLNHHSEQDCFTTLIQNLIKILGGLEMSWAFNYCNVIQNKNTEGIYFYLLFLSL